jgi:hypothetical protein
VRDHYYPEVEDLVKELTGATSVIIFDHTLRNSLPGASEEQPVRHLHNDYTARSAPKRVIDLFGAEAAVDKLRYRVLQLNLWRPVGAPVARDPLVLLDAQSLGADDLVPTELVYPDRRGEIYEVAYNPNHRLFYYPAMTPEEVLVFKGYDSLEDGRARFTPHSAFDLPDADGAAARRSIEVRVLAFFDPVTQ